MTKLSSSELSEILDIDASKSYQAGRIDLAINSLVNIRRAERLWWRGIVEKYKLNEKYLHRITNGGELIREKRRSVYGRKIF